MKITKWTETVMRDSWGDLTDEEFEQVSGAYITAVRAANPDAEINISIVEMVGAQSGLNEVEWEDGDIEPVNLYDDEWARQALKSVFG